MEYALKMALETLKSDMEKLNNKVDVCLFMNQIIINLSITKEGWYLYCCPFCTALGKVSLNPLDDHIVQLSPSTEEENKLDIKILCQNCGKIIPGGTIDANTRTNPKT